MSIEFRNRKEIFSSTVNEKIDEIYKFILELNSGSLIVQLDELQKRLPFTYLHSHYFVGQDAEEAKESSHQVFSHFLQHLFSYIANAYLNSTNLSLIEKKIYISEFFLLILNQYKKYFFYTSKKLDNKVITWFDAVTGNSALIVACKHADSKVVEELLDALIKPFNQSPLESMNVLNPFLRDYIFHENKQHFSAWNIAWLEKNDEMHRVFYRFGSDLRLNTDAFNDFLLQKSPQGDFVLIKAIKMQNSRLINAFLNRIHKPYKGRLLAKLPYFLHEKNNDGFTALNAACTQGNAQIVKILLNAAIKTFTSRSDLALFLKAPNNNKISPLIFASQWEHSSLVYFLLRFARHYLYSAPVNEFFFDFINYEDAEGYTALMRASESGKTEVIAEFIRTCDSSTFRNVPILPHAQIFGFESSQKMTALQLACEAHKVEAVALLLHAMNALDSWTEEYKNFINYKDAEGFSPLDKIILQENKLTQQLLQESRTELSVEEQEQSVSRKKLARLLINYDANSDYAKSNPPEGWTFLHSNRHMPFSLLSQFFSPFCSASPRGKRSIQARFCRLNEEDFLPSLALDNALQIRKESLFSVHFFINKLFLSSLKQVSIIRNKPSISTREIQELSRFEQAVNRHYLQFSDALLNRLKTNSASTLQQALAANNDYILIDSGEDLLILNQAMLFSPLLNPTQALVLASGAKRDNKLMQQWLALYFSTAYTLHPFNSEDVQALSLDGFSDPLVNSDNLFLKLSIEGVSRSSLQELFLLDGKPIRTIDMLEDNFFEINSSRLFFRAERFHKVFFSLNIQEQRAFKNLVLHYSFSTQNQYGGFNTVENLYFETYASQVIDLIRKTEIEVINPAQLLQISINAHERVLSEETDLSTVDKRVLITSLEKFREGLQNSIKTHHKAVLQLLVFLFPSVIRAIAESDPLEIAMPLGLMASDIALNQLLVQFANHPKMQQLFAGNLSFKLLKLTGKIGEKVPLLGSALAMYGLIESGKALVNSSNDDPNHGYYIELLLNNLATIAVLGTEAAFMLPFWPVLGVFTALMVHQIEVEGGIRENQLNLSDAQENFLLNFYRKLKLGFGIRDQHVVTVLEQRELLELTLAYFSKLQSSGSTYAIMGVVLPEVKKVKNSLLCSHANYNPALLLVFPNLLPPPTCEKISLLTDKKSNYSFELGETRNICQKFDALNVLNENYTLLTGSFAEERNLLWLSCVTGQKKVSYGLAKAEGEGEGEPVAALVIDNKLKLSKQFSEQYSIFLPVDPSYVARYDFTFMAGVSDIPQFGDTAVDDLLPCGYPVSYCIDKMVIAIARLYPIQATENKTKTEILIDNSQLSQEKNSYTKELIYLISDSDNLSLQALGIPKQSFVFFSKSLLFQFLEGKLITAQGFESAISEILNLRLEFSNTSSVIGYFEAIENQTIIINRLKGANQTHIAILKIASDNNYAVGLCAHSRFINKRLQLDVQAANDDVIISCNVAAHSKPFYQLMHPINQFLIAKTSDTIIFNLHPANPFTPLATIRLHVIDPILPLNLDISGSYLIEGEPYPSRIILNKVSGYLHRWQTTLKLEINTDLQNQLDLASIQASYFDKLTLILEDNDKPIFIYYLFLQSETHPEINGKFENIQFIEHDQGLFILLKHKNEEEKTFLVMDNTQKKITINTIQYEIDWLYSSIWATLTSATRVIDARELLAPLKIEAKFEDVGIRLENTTCRLGSILIIEPSLKFQIKFKDRTIPFAAIKYQKTIETLQSDSKTNLEPLQDNKLGIGPSRLTQVQDTLYNTKRWLIFLSGIAGSTLAGMVFLFSKRFQRSISTPIAGAVVAPLLTGERVDARADKNNLKNKHSDSSLTTNSALSFLSDPIFLTRNPMRVITLDSKLLLIREDKKPTGSSSYGVPTDLRNNYAQIDGQLTLAYYLGQNLRKFLKTSKNTKSVTRIGKKIGNRFLANTESRNAKVFLAEKMQTSKASQITESPRIQ